MMCYIYFDQSSWNAPDWVFQDIILTCQYCQKVSALEVSMSALSPESLSQLDSMLTLDGLSGSSVFWNTSLFVLPIEPSSLPPVPVPDPIVVSGEGDGDSDSFCWRLSRSRWRLLWLSDFLVMNRPPSLLCLPPGLPRSLLSWQSLLRKSMNLMMVQWGSLSDWGLCWLDLVCILPKNLPGDLPWSAVKYASLVTMSLLPEIYFWQSAMKNTCFKQIKWTSESSKISQNKASAFMMKIWNVFPAHCRVHKEVEVV